MNTKTFHAVYASILQHKYSINAQQLGDLSEFAWSNLGYWSETDNYVEACCQLADQLAQAVALNANDRLLDLGCGQGASLVYWQQQYHLTHIEAVELQNNAVEKIKIHFTKLKKINQIGGLNAIYAASFLNLQHISFQYKFDVVLCLDAAYHSPLNTFLSSVSSVVNAKGRLGFHYLMLSEKWQNLSWIEKKKYQYLLKAADVDLKHLASRDKYIQSLNDHDFEHVEIIDISQQVLHGFAKYAKTLSNNSKKNALDFFKIKMTAKLCERLYRDDLIHYVQISAVQK